MSSPTSCLARKVAGVTAAVVVLALGMGVTQASAATTIDPLPASAPLVEKLYVPLLVTVTCDPFTPLYGSMVGDVVIKQVVGSKEIAHGSKAFPRLTCDSVARTYEMNVFPDGGSATVPPSRPFKKGNAVISAELVNIYDTTERASRGPQTIRLT